MFIENFLEGAYFHQNYVHLHIKNTQNLLVTGDNPVIKHSDFWLFPISPNMYLKFVKEDAGNCFMTESEINRLLFDQAEDFVVASTKECLEILQAP